jgi:putative membrane protein
MKTLNYLALLAISGLSLQACSNRESQEQNVQAMNDSTDLASPSRDATLNENGKIGFIEKAASGGQMEVELGGIAQLNGGSSRVKNFGKMMIADHSKAIGEIKEIAAGDNITLSTALLPEHQKHVDHLKAMHNVDFDKAYMKMMVEDHRKDIKEFEDQAEKADSDKLKAFAARALPVLNVHLDSAKTINNAMKKVVSSGNVSEGTAKQPNH